MPHALESLDGLLVTAWQLAAATLGFRLTAPFLVETAAGENVWVEGFLPDFGGESGMIFCSLDRKAVATQLYQSCVSETYQVFDKAVFIEALSDWGWFGADAERPSWLLPTA